MTTRETLWTDGTLAGASYNADERHRYSLWRYAPNRPLPVDRLDRRRQRVAFLMLNPSTATEVVSDPTVRRCETFARSWGFGALEVVNLFSLRSTDPAALYRTPDADGGRANSDAIIGAAERAEIVVCAWGAHGEYESRAAAVLDLLAPYVDKLRALGITKGGHPRHPLYLKATTELRPFFGMAYDWRVDRASQESV